jgi:peptide/nickel transport system substrate-binding protein
MSTEGKRGNGFTRRDFLRALGVAGGALAMQGLPLRPSFAQSEKYGGILRVSGSYGLTTLSPIMHTSIGEWAATKLMYNNLVRMSYKREVVPDLAESWEPKENGKVWVFNLLKGVKFHIGREVTAEDVVATFQTILDPKNSAPYRGEIGPIDKVEAVDKYTVQFTLKALFADFPSLLTVPNARIVAREGLEDFKVLAGKEYGSGPFKMKEFVPGDHIAVERFPDYYKKGLPYLDGVYFRIIPESSTEITALRKKETDMILEMTPENYSQVATVTGVDAMVVPGGTFNNVIMPADKPPFNDNRVREALKYAVDRNLMLAAIYGAHGELGNDHPVSSAYKFYESLPMRAQDIVKAKALLKEAGYSSGLGFKLFISTSPPAREKIAVILKEMARPAGFQIDIEVMGYDRFLAQVWNKGVPYIGNYGTRPTADAILMKLYHDKEGMDEGRWAPSHPEAIKLLDQAREMVDTEKRKRLYTEFQKISRDEGPFIIPFFRSELSAKWNYVKDYNLNPANFEMELDEVWLTAEAPKKRA